jgi:EAL domain-containing protein (putative c-di-GMP-specific phosphodiesterase class I)
LHGLGKTVTAKEVETEQQLEFLKASGCDVIQGYLLSRPLPPKEAKALIESLPDFAWYLLQK